MPILDRMNDTAINTNRRRGTPLTVLIALVLFAAACGSTSEDPTAQALVDGPQYGDSLDEFLEASDAPKSAASSPPAGFEVIAWEGLIPPGSSGAEISARFDEQIALVEPGSPEADAVFAELQAEYGNQPANPDLAGQDIVLAGFIAPLAYSGELITEFLLVPYFGACIHVPPPPPNQTVMVTLAEGEGISIDDSWGPIWVAGTMSVDSTTTDLAVAGYSMTAAQAGVHVQS